MFAKIIILARLFSVSFIFVLVCDSRSSAQDILPVRIEVDSPYYYNDTVTKDEWKVWVRMYTEPEHNIDCVRWELKYRGGSWGLGALAGKSNERLAPDGNLTGPYVFYDLRVKVRWNDGTVATSKPITVGTIDTEDEEFDWNHDGGYGKNYDWCSDIVTHTHAVKEQPKSFDLYQNYPNPFNPITIIRYDLPKQAEVKLEILDLLGRRIRALVHQQQSAGSYSITWDGRNESGAIVASGAYIYRIDAGDFVRSLKMLFIK